MTQTALILGPTGRFGKHGVDAFTRAGWTVHRFNRRTDDLDREMSRADVVLMAWNPGGYQHWPAQLVELHDRVARAAARTGNTVILPGNVYVYGPEVPMPWTPDTPHLATNTLGRLRIAAEETYRTHGAQVIILRCGDFLDHEATGNWFETYIAKSAKKGFIRYPGDPDAPHAWAYLPDAARAAVALAEARDRLSAFEDVPFPGYTLTGHELAGAVGEALNRPVTLRPFQWGMMGLLRPLMPVLRGVFEMRYLWSLPQRLDGARLAELVPDFRPTPPVTALRRSLAAI